MCTHLRRQSTVEREEMEATSSKQVTTWGTMASEGSKKQMRGAAAVVVMVHGVNVRQDVTRRMGGEG